MRPKTPSPNPLPPRGRGLQSALPLAWLAQTADSETSRSLLDRVLGLTRLSWHDPQTFVGWRFDLPAFAWVLIALGAAAVGLWSYARMMGARPVRFALAAVRALLVLVIAALLAGPTLVLQDEQVEPDWLLVLVDRSASMQVRDTPGTPAPGSAPAPGSPASPASDANHLQSLSRDDVLRRALAAQRDVFASDSAQSLGRQRRIAWLGFGGETFDLPAPAPAPGSAPGSDIETEASANALDWPDAREPVTNLRTAIEQALARAAGRPISGIVLITDGRSAQPTGGELVQRLQQQAVSVFSVPMGADPMPLDLAVGMVEAPEQAFAGDVVPVGVTVDQLGGEQAVDLARVRVRLINEADDQVLDERTLDGTALGRPLRLHAREPEPGIAHWRVEISYDNPRNNPRINPRNNPTADAGAHELTRDNNQRRVAVEMVDRPLRVLYVEGYPRWEYRYLKSMLMREESIASSMYLLSADRAFAQEGDVPIARLPRTAQELADYDVIIIGDVPASTFTSDQITLLRDHVATRGAGLLWIAGERHTPASYDETPLNELLPMRQPAAVSRLRGVGGGIDMLPTALARQLSVLVLQRSASDDDARTVEASAWPDRLPSLVWAQALGALKPTAEVLAQTSTASAAIDAEPLVVRLRYGAGQSVYVGTDETWRWRYGQGELYFEQFWIQLVRLLGRQRIQQTNEQVRLTVSHRRVDVADTVVVELVVEDPALLARELAQVAVTVHPSDPAGEALTLDRLELRPVSQDTGGANGAADASVAESRRVYRAQWQPTVAGALTLRVAEPALGGLELARTIEVIAPDDELRRPQPDHARLAALAEQTGGQVVALDQLAQLADLVPNRARRTPNDVREPIWNSSLALVLVLVLLTGEWIVRKTIRLV